MAKVTNSLSEEMPINESMMAFFAKMKSLTTRELGKNPSKIYTKFTKADYRQYMENPIQNEKNIRDMSHFFYRVSTPYWRLIKYYSELHLLYWNVVPQLDFASEKEADKTKLLKNYYKVLQLLNTMNIDHEMRKVINSVFLDGVFYGYIYKSNDSFYIHPFDPDYCQICGIEDGVFNFAFNFEYYDKQKVELESVDTKLQAQYKSWKDGKADKWQPIESKNSICIKANEENMQEILPPLVGLFEDLIDLIDYKSLMRNKEEIHNYKLLVEKIPRRESSNKIDDFALNLDTAANFHEMTQDAVPEQVGVVFTPMDIDTIEFKPDDSEVDTVAKAVRTVFDDSGTSAMLFNSDKSGMVGLQASIHTDEAMVFSVVKQIERWIRRYLKFEFKQQLNFKFMDATIFNRDTIVNREMSLAKSSMPNKIAVMAADGIDPLTFLSSLSFEGDILKLHERLTPLQTSFTQSPNSDKQTDPEKGGRPPLPDEEISDSTAKGKDRKTEIET